MDRDHSALLERLKGSPPESDFSLLDDLMMKKVPYAMALAGLARLREYYPDDSWQVRTAVRNLERYG